MKKILYFVLSALMLILALSVSIFSASALETSGQCGDSVYWEFDTSCGELTIYGDGCMYDWSDSPFANQSDIYSVVIEDGITNISDMTFYECCNLTSVEIPDTVTDIGEFAFSQSGLTAIVLPDSVTNIEQGAFEFCYDLNSITLSSGIKSLGDSVFNCCESLEDVKIPNSIENISNNLFYGCYNLVSVRIPNSVKTFGDNAFANCNSGLTIYTTADATNAIWYAQSNQINYEIVSSIEHINLIKFEGSPATCQNTGVMDYWYCCDCYKYFSNEEATNEITIDIDDWLNSDGIIPVSHSFTCFDAEEATCTESGNETYYICEKCNTIFDVDKQIISEIPVIDALGHEWNAKNKVDATCTNGGYTEYACIRIGCNATKINDFTNATGHSFTVLKSVVAPTCIKVGYTVYECANGCGQTEIKDETATSDHNYVDGVCSICGKEESPQEQTFAQMLSDTLQIIFDIVKKIINLIKNLIS